MLNRNSATLRKENILDRISKRNKDRQNYLDLKVEQRQKEQMNLEGADYFSETFGERVHEIETEIKNICEQQTKTPESDIPTSELACHFQRIQLDIQELERYLTSSTLFLTDYKIKSCQTIVQDLTSKCEETRLRLLPKKKFGFSVKKITPQSKINTTPKSNTTNEISNISEKNRGSLVTWTICKQSDEYICLSGEQVNGRDITISDLMNCFVELQGHAGSVQISNASNCVFLSGPISRSLFVENCHQITLAGACQQLRLHSSTSCLIYLHVTCRGIIEDSTEISIAEYCYNYSGIETDFELAGLDKTQNNYKDIADFNWLSPEVSSPNWSIVKECTQPDWIELKRKYKFSGLEYRKNQLL